MKKCSRCGHSAPFSEFKAHKQTRDGFDSQCRSCRRDSERARRYTGGLKCSGVGGGQHAGGCDGFGTGRSNRSVVCAAVVNKARRTVGDRSCSGVGGMHARGCSGLASGLGNLSKGCKVMWGAHPRSGLGANRLYVVERGFWSKIGISNSYAREDTHAGRGYRTVGSLICPLGDARRTESAWLEKIRDLGWPNAPVGEVPSDGRTETFPSVLTHHALQYIIWSTCGRSVGREPAVEPYVVGATVFFQHLYP